MPTDTLTPIAGDPAEVQYAGRTLQSIAADIAATAAQLRALASSNHTTVHWTGSAALRAASRAISLPPKLEKAHASYATAGNALTTYATALGAAQAASASAVRAAATAESDLASARAAQQAAASRDAMTAAAATATGQPAPPATAPRYNAVIADAASRLTRAKTAHASAQAEQEAAAKRAAAALKEASRQGIPNKKWWQQALADAGHWANAAWTDSLRFISTTATTISALAGIAGLVLAVAGIFCPPLEIAAAVCETISLVSGSVGAVADIALAATGKASWTTVGWDAVALGPWAAAKATTKLTPLIHDTRIFSPSTIAHANTGMRTTLVDTTDSENVFRLSSGDTWGDLRTLLRHFKGHADDFGATMQEEYADMAAEFLLRSQEEGLPTKISVEGTIRVYEPASNTFGSYNPMGKTRTFFKPSGPGYWDRQDGMLIEELMKW